MLLAVECLKMGLLDPPTIQQGIDLQQKLAGEGKPMPLLEVFVRTKKLSLEVAKGLMKQQKLEKLPAEGNPAFIPGYRITRRLGKGGMAIVFEAEQEATGEIVALKILQPIHNGKPVEVERFRREAQLLREFRHENIVRGLDLGETKGLHWFAMECVRGESVQAALDRDGPLDEDRALYVIVHVAKALDYCQGKGILHRDIKPENIMVTGEGRIVLCDLGFAKPIGSTEGDAAGQTCGTVQYISPEQARGARDVDIRSDIYSLGATLWHLVVGQVPFAGGESMEVMAKHVLEELENPRAKNANVSSHLHYFIMKMMAKEREIRYQSPKELVDDISSQILGKKSMVYTPGGGPTTADELFDAPPPDAAMAPRADPVRRVPSSDRIPRRRR